MKRVILIIVCCNIFFCACRQKDQHKPLTEEAISMLIKQLTVVMVHDVTNPPLAARFYAYACLAGYEVAAQNDRTLKPMFGMLNEYPNVDKPLTTNGYNTDISAVLAIYKTAEALQPSGDRLKIYENRFIDSCRAVGFSDVTISRSLEYAVAVSNAILAYAKADRYNKISNYRRYTPGEQAGDWNPTPPSYMSPVEPYFNTVRPFTLLSASQFFIADPVKYSLNRSSAFFKLMQQNIKKGSADLTQREKDIANFWDCNPFAVQVTGHMLIGLKKISPGAHWIGIASQACIQQHTGFNKALKVHTILAIGLTDAFISCWDSKYKTNRIRPETAIRKSFSKNWKPFLQTPPFPEYLSGHSVISSASAVILTDLLGTHFSFVDSVEIRYGIPPRRFRSFNDAAKEAAISRFYGGIHFLDAINNGLVQGGSVGNYVITRYHNK